MGGTRPHSGPVVAGTVRLHPKTCVISRSKVVSPSLPVVDASYPRAAAELGNRLGGARLGINWAHIHGNPKFNQMSHSGNEGHTPAGKCP